MHVAIVGSREYPHPTAVEDFVQRLAFQYPDAVVVSGGARGVDKRAELKARAVGLETLIFPADWKKYGRGAGFKRNADIIRAASVVVAFYDGSSRGTKHSMKLAEDAGKQLYVYGPDGRLVRKDDA